MFYNFKKEVNEVDTHDVEEITEKPTTKIGYLLLIIMGVIIFSFGQWVIFDVKDFIQKPIPPTNCLGINTQKDDNYNYSTAYPYNNYYRNNYYNPSVTDEKYGLSSVCKTASELNTKISNTYLQINNLESQINSLNSQIRNEQTQYDLSLQERQANYNQNHNSEIIYNNIAVNNQQLQVLNTEKDKLQSEIDNTQNKFLELKTENENAYLDALSDYESKFRWYIILVFLAQLVFILPIFLIALKIYSKLKKQNSANSIIAGAVLIPVTLLLIQITIGWVWNLIPKSWIDVLLEIFAQLAVFRYVIYYGAIIIAIVVLGGIVYIIQKRIFSPEKVALRRLKENKCPSCEFPINDNDFCSKCGTKLKENCSVCGQKRMCHMSYCSSCGNKKEHIK